MVIATSVPTTGEGELPLAEVVPRVWIDPEDMPLAEATELVRFTPVPPPQRSRAFTILAAFVLALAAAGAGWYVVERQQQQQLDDSVAAATPPSPPVAEPPVPAAAPVPPPVVESPPVVEAPVVEAPEATESTVPPPTVTIRFTSTPLGAEVRIEGEKTLLGVTPFSEEFPIGETRTFQVLLDGYTTARQTLELDVNTTISTSLAKIPPARPVTTPKPRNRKLERGGTMNVFEDP